MIYLTPLLRFNSACFHFKVVVNGVVLDCILFDILLFHASAKTTQNDKDSPQYVIQCNTFIIIIIIVSVLLNLCFQ